MQRWKRNPKEKKKQKVGPKKESVDSGRINTHGLFARQIQWVLKAKQKGSAMNQDTINFISHIKYNFI